ncbi:hypothetical protein RCH16_001560 [Cryobacterium sp. MP_M5]|uniref:hypothetical protein n=1 Tax=unclassified Cryobacterium TaxID=2649013 RepID=UPI0018CAE9E0|nr:MULTISPECIES: hypothetical protein [unclassified Cryobacterium]MEC5176552.1 hypothetical protein [Cryobacterium sp. MP_M5]
MIGAAPFGNTRTTNWSGRQRATVPWATSSGNAGKVGPPCPRVARLMGVVASATHPARRSPTAALSAGQATASAASIQTADQ